MFDYAGRFGWSGIDRDRYDHAEAAVVAIIDGRSVAIAMCDQGSENTVVHLLGVACPSSGDGQAVRFLQETVLGRRVRLALDPNRRTRDHESRLLAYVFGIEDGRMLNQALIESGLANADRNYPHVMDHDFQVREKRAAKSRPGTRSGVAGM